MINTEKKALKWELEVEEEEGTSVETSRIFSASSSREEAAITGLIVTKLDGSAKGGMLVALAEKLKLPVHAIGVGEGAGDLRPFTAQDYARALVGLE